MILIMILIVIVIVIVTPRRGSGQRLHPCWRRQPRLRQRRVAVRADDAHARDFERVGGPRCVPLEQQRVAVKGDRHFPPHLRAPRPRGQRPQRGGAAPAHGEEAKAASPKASGKAATLT